MTSHCCQEKSDVETNSRKNSRLLRHGSHLDISRWHPKLDGAVVKECSRNPLPSFLKGLVHPTHARLTHVGIPKAFVWSSRSHRKNGYVSTSPKHHYLRSSQHLWDNITHMGRMEYWNISWWVAQAFTWGSIIWVVNGFAAFLPFCNAHFDEAPISTGWTAFLGATVFEIGSIAGILEAWNIDDVVRFGQNVKDALSHPAVALGNSDDGPLQTEDTFPEDDMDKASDRKWIWFSKDHKYFHELGFLGAFFQLIGATIFWIGGFTAIPAIHDSIKGSTPLLNGVFWTPQVAGGSGFIISSTLIMLESQKVWWKPQIVDLGWHIGFWNFIGGLGFTLCGILGYAKGNHTTQYHSSLSTFWGGWAFLIGSVLQWYESVNSKL